MPNARNEEKTGRENEQDKTVKLPALPMRLVLGLVVAILLDTVSQVLWKRAAQDLPDDAMNSLTGALIAVAHQPLFLVVGLLFIAQMVNWLHVLADADVSYALPITALSYVTVAGASALWLGEAITLPRVIGMALILSGVVVISRTEHNTLLNRPGPP